MPPAGSVPAGCDTSRTSSTGWRTRRRRSSVCCVGTTSASGSSRCPPTPLGLMAEPVPPVPVPRRVIALYVLLTAEPEDADSTGAGLAAAPSTPQAPPVPPVSLLLARGISKQQAEQVQRLPHARALSHEAEPRQALENERRTLGEALTDAAVSDAVV